MDSGQEPLSHHPGGAMVPCEVRWGVPHRRADDNDRYLAATSYDAGSEFEVVPRADGKGKDVVIAGTIPNLKSEVNETELEPSENV